MSIIQSLLDRACISDDSILNIIIIGNEPIEFIDFLKRLPHNYIKYSDIYHGNFHPNIILCNNKIDNYEKCRELSITYHIPTITVDHVLKSDILDNDKLKFIDNLPCATKVAINMPIHRSWHSIHDKILPYNINNDEMLNAWQHLLIYTSKKVFSL